MLREIGATLVWRWLGAICGGWAPGPMWITAVGHRADDLCCLIHGSLLLRAYCLSVWGDLACLPVRRLKRMRRRRPKALEVRELVVQPQTSCRSVDVRTSRMIPKWCANAPTGARQEVASTLRPEKLIRRRPECELRRESGGGVGFGGDYDSIAQGPKQGWMIKPIFACT